MQDMPRLGGENTGTQVVRVPSPRCPACGSDKVFVSQAFAIECEECKVITNRKGVVKGIKKICRMFKKGINPKGRFGSDDYNNYDKGEIK